MIAQTAPWGIDAGQLMLIAGILLLIATLMRLLYRRQTRDRQKAPVPALPARAPDYEMSIKLYELFRELSARLDTKIYILNELLSRAHAESAELRRLLERRSTGVAEPVPGSQTSPEKGDRLVVEFEPDRSTPPATDEAKRRIAAVVELADRGASAGQISEQLGLQLGEVELILALRRQRQDSGLRGPARP
jgi:hypothetical protein